MSLFVTSLLPIQSIFGELDQDKQVVESKIVQFRIELEHIKGQANEILRKVESVQKQIDLVKSRIFSLDNEKIILENNIIEKEAQIKTAKSVFDEKKLNVYRKARQVYEDSTIDYIAVVLASFDLTDFINNSEYYSIIKKREKQEINKIKEERIKLKEQQKEIEVAQVVLEKNKQKAVVEKENLEVESQKLETSKSIINEAVALKISQLNAEETALSSINVEIAAAQIRYAVQIAALKKEVAGFNNNGLDIHNTARRVSFDERNASLLGFIWPVSGPIISEYGPRVGAMHRGLDIGAPHGAPIVAAGRGVVLAAGFTYDGFGGKVVIQHANNLITLYGHMSFIGVAVGSIVEQGQYIGDVGNTGNSCGAHLHFQISNTNNMYDVINPRNYLT